MQTGQRKKIQIAALALGILVYSTPALANFDAPPDLGPIPTLNFFPPLLPAYDTAQESAQKSQQRQPVGLVCTAARAEGGELISVCEFVPEKRPKGVRNNSSE